MAFEIANGVLKRYTEEPGVTAVVIPDGVKKIGTRAFSNCNNILSVRLPDTVTEIAAYAFSKCDKLETVILSRDLTKLGYGVFSYNKSFSSVEIPKNVSEISDYCFVRCVKLRKVILNNNLLTIGSGAFEGCENLESIDIPNSVTRIASCAFKRCTNLSDITLSKSLISIDETAFEDCKNIKGFNSPDEFPNMDVDTVNGFFSTNLKLFKPKTIANVMLHSMNPEVLKKLSVLDIATLNNIGSKMSKVIISDPNPTVCKSAETFVKSLYPVIDYKILKDIYYSLKETKIGSKSADSIDKNAGAKAKITSNGESISSPEEIVLVRTNEKKITTTFKNEYKFNITELPELTDKNANKLKNFVFAWLLCINDLASTKTVAYNKPGYCDEAKDIVNLLDPKSFQSALLQLAKSTLRGTGNKLYIAYPLCRYADEETLGEIIKISEKNISVTSGKNAPVIKMVRNACKYSTHNQALFFAEKYKDLDAYAAIRGTDAETIRDTVLSDVGLSADGTKSYELGNQTVTVRMQPDYSFIVELEGGKTAKSLPKKGAETDLYEAANKDFSDMKKNVKKIVKNRFAVLFEDFLSGKEKNADSWNAVYTANPVLKQAAQMIVWAQGDKTFTMTAGGLIDSNENAYTLSNAHVKVAHPMEMQADDVERWQKYFTAHALKQPFLQIWEPVRDPETIKEDRYASAMIPFYRFTNQEKHGITVDDNDFHNNIRIYFKGLTADVKRIDWSRHSIHPDDRFEVQKISFKEYTRQTNHVITYLDKITVWDRVRNDDTTVAEMLPNFTLAQITEFITAAQEANAVNVLAQLMEYKNNNFADFDPMDEFTLDW